VLKKLSYILKPKKAFKHDSHDNILSQINECRKMLFEKLAIIWHTCDGRDE
jgi:hypothetical protein